MAQASNLQDLFAWLRHLEGEQCMKIASIHLVPCKVAQTPPAPRHRHARQPHMQSMS